MRLFRSVLDPGTVWVSSGMIWLELLSESFENVHFRSPLRYAVDQSHDGLSDATLLVLHTIETGRIELLLHHSIEVEQQAHG
jgi:hypothetical protein